MGEDVIIQIWCDRCENEGDNDCGDIRYNSRANLRERLIEKGWAISRKYNDYAYCPKCARGRGL